MEKTYVVHAREGCPFCDSALNLLSSRRGEASYCVVFYENRENPKLLEEQARWSWNTVPVVVELTTNEYGDEEQRLIGGYTDLCDELGVDPDGF